MGPENMRILPQSVLFLDCPPTVTLFGNILDEKSIGIFHRFERGLAVFSRGPPPGLASRRSEIPGKGRGAMET